MAECLADELINAAKGSSNSYAIKVSFVRWKPGPGGDADSVISRKRTSWSELRNRTGKSLSPSGRPSFPEQHRDTDWEGYGFERICCMSTLCLLVISNDDIISAGTMKQDIDKRKVRFGFFGV